MTGQTEADNVVERSSADTLPVRAREKRVRGGACRSVLVISIVLALAAMPGRGHCQSTPAAGGDEMISLEALELRLKEKPERLNVGFMLTDGSSIKGVLVGITEKVIFIRMPDGAMKQILRANVKAAMVLGAGQLPRRSWGTEGGTAESDPEPAPQIKLPTLEETLLQLLGRLNQEPTKSGMIAKVEGERIYITLGRLEGVRVGDEFEIVRRITEIKHPLSGKKISEERDVAGRLKATSVQDQLSVCSLLSGQAEQKNDKGELNKVVNVGSSGKKKLSLGAVKIEGSGAVAEQGLMGALIAALGRADNVRLVDADETAFELRCQAKNVPLGAQLLIGTFERQSGNALNAAEGLYKATYSAKDLGYATAVVVRMESDLDLDAIYESAKSIVQARRTKSALLFRDLGVNRHAAVVHPDGKVIIVDRRPFEKLKIYDDLESTYAVIFSLCRKAQGTLPEDLATTSWRNTAHFHSDCGRVFREIHFDGSVFNGVLSVPKSAVREAWFFSTGVLQHAKFVSLIEAAAVFGRLDQFKFAIADWNDQSAFRKTINITPGYRYGEHTFTIYTEGKVVSLTVYSCLRVLTTDTDTCPTIQDSTTKQLIGRTGPACGSVADLPLPVDLASR